MKKNLCEILNKKSRMVLIKRLNSCKIEPKPRENELKIYKERRR